jgi:hypothetical protein
MSSVRDSHWSRDYHKGTGSRVFLTENPGRYRPGLSPWRWTDNGDIVITSFLKVSFCRTRSLFCWFLVVIQSVTCVCCGLVARPHSRLITPRFALPWRLWTLWGYLSTWSNPLEGEARVRRSSASPSHPARAQPRRIRKTHERKRSGKAKEGDDRWSPHVIERKREGCGGG